MNSGMNCSRNTASMSDPYLIPNTFTLKNTLGITDPELLQLTESEKVRFRSIELVQSNRNVQVSMSSLKTIHKTLFRDVYEWAGQYRTIYISKENDYGVTRFLPYEHIASDGNKTMDHLNSVLRHINGDPLNKLLDSLADVYLELNHIHPFREGNGRTQKLFFRNVAKQHGLVIDWKLIAKSDHIEAAVRGGLGDPSMMREHFRLIGRKLDENFSTPRFGR